jgi:hypothetical protein
MEYALLMRTMPSSPAALAALDGKNIRANANSATEQMLRITMDLLLVANGVERLSRVVRVPEILSHGGRGRGHDQGDR